jgi:hypothetical protein
MNPRNTWLWVVTAAGLFAFIFFYERHAHHLDGGPRKVIPGLKAAGVTSVQLRLAGQPEIRAERTNGAWQLTAPLLYPAQAPAIEGLLAALDRLTPSPYLTGQELKNHPHPDEEFGFDSSQVSLVVQQEDYQGHIQIGNRTPPGDQVYVRVIGDDGVCVVDDEFLKLLPRQANDWRQSALADFKLIPFNRIVVTNAGNILELQRNATNQPWRMVLPMKTRADNDKVEEALRRLQDLHVYQFISDDPKADLESFGLQPPELSLALAQGANTVLLLEFGKTNSAGLVYARRHDQNTVVTVSKDLQEPWRASHEVFRDHHLVTLTGPLDEIEIHARDTFTLKRQTSNSWRVVLPQGQGFPADTALVDELIARLNGLQVAQFVKDVVTLPDLPGFGLDPPTRQFILKTAVTNDAAATTNSVVTRIDFGVQEGKVFARRAGEDFVFAIKPADFEPLNLASVQMRDRRIWNFTTNDVARLTIRQDGKTRQLVRKGAASWSLAPGSQGVIDDVMAATIEETVFRIGGLTAVAWVGHGDQERARAGFTQNGRRIIIELKTGEQLSIEFGGEAPSGSPYAAVVIDNEPWIFEFPWPPYEYVQLYLKIPANP